MKLYLIDYSMNEQAPQAVYIGKYSQYKVGVKITKDGISVSPVKLFNGATEISSDGEFNGYTTFPMTALSAPGRTDHTAKVGNIRFQLQINTTDSNVVELSCGS